MTAAAAASCMQRRATQGRAGPSHFWAQFDPQNGAHCQAIIVFILTQSVGPTHLSITHCIALLYFTKGARGKDRIKPHHACI